MMRLLVLLPLLATPALAQQQPVPPPMLEQRVGAQIGQLVIRSEALAIQVEQLQQALAGRDAEIRALKDKYEKEGPAR